MLNRTLYPQDLVFRVLFWTTIVLTVFSWACLVYFYYYLEAYNLPWHRLTFFLFGGPICQIILFLLQPPVVNDTEQEYTRVISDIGRMVTQLDSLSKFLEGERAKVSESEATLLKLQTEKAELEPVIMTQRETVNAILAAHTKAIASKAWRERALGFISGMLASLLASILFQLWRG